MKTEVEYIDQFKIVKEPQTNFNRIHKTVIQSSRAGYNFIKQFYNGDLGVYESFYLVLLSRCNSTMAWVKISQGGISGTVTDVRLIAKHAIESLCSSVIIAHNHPSGNLKPSQADLHIAAKVKEALKLFDIVVLDSLILTEESYFSFADEGLI